jgi:hypothetical protein
MLMLMQLPRRPDPRGHVDLGIAARRAHTEQHSPLLPGGVEYRLDLGSALLERRQVDDWIRQAVPGLSWMIM